MNSDTLKFANKLHTEYRLGKFNMKDAYILFKDHKPNFENKLQSRLINPSKTELRIISKNIVLNIQKATHNNLWKNLTDTIRNIKNKWKATFIQFDIINLYPISKEVVIDNINYAKNYVEITDEQYQIILASRKTVLKNNDSTRIKTGLDNFDVPMGGYDSAQIADLVGLYIYQITLVRSLTWYKFDYTVMTVFHTSPIVMGLSVLV